MTIWCTGTFSVILVLLLNILTGCQNTEGMKNQVASNQSVTLNLPSASGNNQGSPKESASQMTRKPSAGVTEGIQSSSKTINLKMGKVTAVRLADFNTGWIGGEGWIARTDDAGKSWRGQYQVEGTVKQLFALNDQDAWATVSKNSTASNELLLFRTNDGGNHWSLVGKVPNQGFLHFISNQEAFNGNWKTTDGGKTWTTLSIPKNVVGDAYFHDDHHGWAVIQEKNTFQVVRTIDGGKTWHAVMTRKTIAPLNGVLIRSAGTDDAWIECIGDSGMTQTSYSLFHTADGGKGWQTVIAKASAGGGPAPGFPMDYTEGPTIGGSSPGPLYVVNSKVAFMGGQCMACDRPNTIGWTMDGGKTVVKGTESFEGYGEMLMAFADARNGWLICTDHTEPSVMYTTSDGGKHWRKVSVFN
jgi:photosystem II stability/assembly factor-like uncharacterized protein